MEEREDLPFTMKSKFRWLLVLDGILVMLLCVVLLAMFVPEVYRRYTFKPRPRGPVVGTRQEKATSEGKAIQDIDLTAPLRVPGTNVSVIEIKQRDLARAMEIPPSRRMSMSMSSAYRSRDYKFLGLSNSATTVNLFYFSDEDPEGYLLFDRRVLLQGVAFPTEPDDPRAYMLVRAITDDTDGDGRLTGLDDRSLWIADLDGRNCSRISTDGMTVKSMSFSPDRRRVFFVALRRPADRSIPAEHWDQSLLVYDVDSRELSDLSVTGKRIREARALLQE